MRILILGAGGVGGYFGGRLIEAGADVTFFVREARARRIAEDGLAAKSPLGDFRLKARTISEPGALKPFDLVVLTCKAYDLDASLEQVRSAVAPNTAILPLLNGLVHLDEIARRLPQARLWGGVAHISATLTPDGVVHHFAEVNRIIFGSRGGMEDERINELHAFFSKTPVNAQVSVHIDQDLWDKFTFLATLAGMTCLMRASIGNILATPSGEGLILRLLAECEAVARAEGFSPQPDKRAAYRAELTKRGSTVKSSMLRDIERGGRTEGEHILGDTFARATRTGCAAPLLETALTHVRAYEIERVTNAG
jgi:2-dehydropantoate 2-reductase